MILMKILFAVALVCVGLAGAVEATPPFSRGGTGGVSITGTITVTELDTDRVFQRDGTARSMTFAGTYTGNPDQIQIRIILDSDSSVAQDWTTLGSQSIAAGSWSGTLSVPQGGPYRFSARVLGNTAITATSANKWGIGAVIAALGQSLIVHQYDQTNSQGFVPDANTKRFIIDGWKALSATTSSAENTANSERGAGSAAKGPGGIVLANQIRTLFAAGGHNIPVGLIMAAYGGTASTRWVSVANGGTGDAWASFAATAALSLVGSEFEAVIWQQGESDGSGAVSKSTFKANYDLILAQLWALSGRNASSFKFIIAQIGSSNFGSSTDSSVQNIREALSEWAVDNAANGVAGPIITIDGLHASGDSVHWIYQSYVRAARRFAQEAAYSYGYTAFRGVGPKITAATFTEGGHDITLTVAQSGGTGLLDGAGSASGAGLLGFRVLISGSPETVTATAFSGGNIVLTVAAALTAASPPSVWFGYGMNPFGYAYDGGGATDLAILGHIPYDNQSALIGDTVGFPLQPTDGAITASAI